MLRSNLGDFEDVFNLVGFAIEHEGITTVGILLGKVNQLFEAGGFYCLHSALSP